MGGRGACEVGRGEGLADSNNSMKDTWKELKIQSVDQSQRRYALEWGAYPMRVQGMERWLIFGLLVGMSTKARQQFHGDGTKRAYGYTKVRKVSYCYLQMRW
jgi:hypothetical protein